jgi:hypothetical protein
MGMTYEELLLIAAVIAQGVLVLWQLNAKKTVIMDDLSQLLDDAVDELDGRLAQALGSIAENIGMGGSLEPPNPFQALIAQYIQAKIGESSQMPQILNARDQSGKFSTLKDDILDDDAS